MSQYKKEVLPELEERKQMLANKRNIHSSLDHKLIQEHQRKYNEIKKMKQKERESRKVKKYV